MFVNDFCFRYSGASGIIASVIIIIYYTPNSNNNNNNRNNIFVIHKIVNRRTIICKVVIIILLLLYHIILYWAPSFPGRFNYAQTRIICIEFPLGIYTHAVVCLCVHGDPRRLSKIITSLVVHRDDVTPRKCVPSAVRTGPYRT